MSKSDHKYKWKQRKSNGTDEKDDIGSVSTFYQTLVELYIHQDQLYWNTIQLLFTIQAAVLTAGYVLRHTWISILALLLGAFVTWLIFLNVLKVEMDRDKNLSLLTDIGNFLSKTSSKLDGKRIKKSPSVSLTSIPPKRLKFLRGRYIIRFIIFLLIFFDIFFAIIFCF